MAGRRRKQSTPRPRRDCSAAITVRPLLWLAAPFTAHTEAWPDLCSTPLQLEPHRSAHLPGPATLTSARTQAVLDNADLLARVMQHLGALDSTRFRERLFLFTLQ